MTAPSLDILLADIGGTTSRFACMGAGGRPERIATFANEGVESFEAMVAHHLESGRLRHCAAVLAVAGPVEGEEIALTNRAWRFRLDDLGRRFGWSQVRAINDFEALAFALPALGAADLRMLGSPRADAPGVRVVLGPGTGLGVAAAIPAGRGWQALASEGGHISFGPASRDEAAIFARLAEAGPVSAEMVLSGPGLARLHCAMHPETLRLSSEMILTQARAGGREARQTVALFVRLLGRFAGDAALAFKATGGVYVTGGVATALGPLLDAAVFRAAFEAHPPHGALLRRMPTALITCTEPGLLGCAALAAQMRADG